MKKTKKKQEEVKKPSVIVKLKCRECGGSAKLGFTEKKMFDNLSLKASRCHQCQKFGTQIATVKIGEETIRKAVLTYCFDKKKKKVEIKKETNDDYKEKKRIYPLGWSKEELNKARPFKGINDPSNYGINGDCFVDENCSLLN